MCGGVMCPQEQVSVFLARKEKKKKKKRQKSRGGCELP